MLARLFEDHFDSYLCWKEAEFKGLTCVHVDAHLDLMTMGLDNQMLQGMAEATSLEELSHYRSDSGLPLAGCHCGNYLYPAINEGIVQELIWVVPPYLIRGDNFVDGVRAEVQNWLDLSLEDYSSLRGRSGYVEGTLWGKRFIVCTSDNFPHLSEQQKENLALDIDVDYFLNAESDQVWQSPEQLKTDLGIEDCRVLTVALSIEGGYTPWHQRFLGTYVYQLFGQEAFSEANDYAQLLAADSIAEASERVEKLQELLPLLSSSTLRACVFAKLGQEKEAKGEDPWCCLRPEDKLARLLILKSYDQGIEFLKSFTSPQEEVLYLGTYLGIGKKDARLVLQYLEPLLRSSRLWKQARIRLLILAANANLDLARTKQARRNLEEALELGGGQADIYVLLGDCLQLQGDLKGAAKALRKALRISQGKISSLKTMLLASRVHELLGQASMAQSLRRELEKVDVTGRFAVHSILDASKL